MRWELVVVRTYRRGESVEVAMHVELRAGEPFCWPASRSTTRAAITGCASRSRFPNARTPLRPRGSSRLSSAGLEAEGGHGEVPPTFPARGFVDAGGVAVLLDHVMEYEVVEGRELALTLLRSIGLISRADNPYREVNAGPGVALPRAVSRAAEHRLRALPALRRGSRPACSSRWRPTSIRS